MRAFALSLTRIRLMDVDAWTSCSSWGSRPGQHAIPTTKRVVHFVLWAELYPTTNDPSHVV